MVKIAGIQGFVERLSRQEKIYFYGAVIVVSLLIVDRAFIAPSLSKAQAQSKEIEEKTLIIKKDLRILALQDTIQEQRQKYESYFARISSLEEERTLILKEIENLANENEVYLIYVRPGEIVTDGPFQNLTVQLNCEGGMPQIVSFLYALESSSKLMTITKYVLSPKSESSSIAQCRISISKILVP